MIFAGCQRGRVAERSFAREVESLRLGAGETFEGEAILAVTKALLQAGVAYVGGYQGAPVSHLMDVLADARGILDELGVRFESSASEATAAAMLAASDQLPDPRRGDLEVHGRHQRRLGCALESRLCRRHGRRVDRARRGLRRGRQHHAGAHPRLRDEVADVAARSTPGPARHRADGRAGVRALRGKQHAGDADDADPRLPHARPLRRERQPPACLHRGGCAGGAPAQLRPDHPAAVDLQPGARKDRTSAGQPRSSSSLGTRSTSGTTAIFNDIGIVLQGGLYNTLLRALERLGLADVFGASRVPLYVLNVTYPLVPAELAAFAEGKRALLVVEEGQPEYLEQSIGLLLRQAGLATEVIGKGPFPRAGEYTGAGDAPGRRSLRRALPAGGASACRTRPRPVRSDPCGSNRCCRRRRSQGRCPRGPRVSAPAVRSDRSSPR